MGRKTLPDGERKANYQNYQAKYRREHKSKVELWTLRHYAKRIQDYINHGGNLSKGE
jgi:hypothetical protein